MSYNDIDNITFWGMNIPKELELIMDKANDDINESFDNDEQRKAYHLGVQNTLSVLKQLLDDAVRQDNITFYYPDTETTEEMSADEIVEWASELEY